jgi:hypothetical protein
MKNQNKTIKTMKDKETEDEYDELIRSMGENGVGIVDLSKDTSDYWMEKIKPDIYQLIDQLIKEGKNQGYKISVTIE